MQQPRGDLLQSRTELGDIARREGAAGEPAQPGVGRPVQADHRVRADGFDHAGSGRDTEQPALHRISGLENFPAHSGAGADRGMPQDRIAQLVVGAHHAEPATYQTPLPAQPLVTGVRIDDHLRVEHPAGEVVARNAGRGEHAGTDEITQ